MGVIYFKRETVFKLVYLSFIFNYSVHSHDHVSQKLGFTLQNQYCFSKWDTIGNVSANKLKIFVTGLKKVPYGPHPPAPSHPTPPLTGMVIGWYGLKLVQRFDILEGIWLTLCSLPLLSTYRTEFLVTVEYNDIV